MDGLDRLHCSAGRGWRASQRPVPSARAERAAPVCAGRCRAAAMAAAAARTSRPEAIHGRCGRDARLSAPPRAPLVVESTAGEQAAPVRRRGRRQRPPSADPDGLAAPQVAARRGAARAAAVPASEEAGGAPFGRCSSPVVLLDGLSLAFRAWHAMAAQHHGCVAACGGARACRGNVPSSSFLPSPRPHACRLGDLTRSQLVAPGAAVVADASVVLLLVCGNGPVAGRAQRRRERMAIVTNAQSVRCPWRCLPMAPAHCPQPLGAGACGPRTARRRAPRSACSRRCRCAPRALPCSHPHQSGAQRSAGHAAAPVRLGQQGQGMLLQLLLLRPPCCCCHAALVHHIAHAAPLKAAAQRVAWRLGAAASGTNACGHRAMHRAGVPVCVRWGVAQMVCEQYRPRAVVVAFDDGPSFRCGRQRGGDGGARGREPRLQARGSRCSGRQGRT